jgi:hypothetical protein
VYWIFFLALFWMPITGFLTSYSGGHPIKLFDLIPTPDFLPRDKARAEFFRLSALCWTMGHLRPNRTSPCRRHAPHGLSEDRNPRPHVAGDRNRGRRRISPRG